MEAWAHSPGRGRCGMLGAMQSAPASRSAARVLLKPGLQATAAALLALAVYIRTLAPTVMWYDMGEFATAAYVLGIAHNTGYPLFLLLGKLFTLLPVGDIAYRVNLLSAVSAALTVLLTYLIVFELTTRRGAALVAALTLAFTSTLWSNATWATSYDLNAFLTVLILFLLLRWRTEMAQGAPPSLTDHADDPSSGQRASRWKPHRELFAASLVFGLSLGNHRLILVVAPALAYLIWRAQRSGAAQLGWRGCSTLGALFLLGFSVNLYLPLRAVQDPAVNWGDPSNLERFLRMVTTGYARAFVNPFASGFDLALRIGRLALFPAYEFTAFGLILAGIGAWRLWLRDRDFTVATGLVAVSAAVMVSVYGIHNIFNYFQPIYLVLAIWLGVGVAAALVLVGERLTSSNRWRFTFLTEGRRSALATALFLTIPLLLASRSFNHLDRSDHWDASDYVNYLFETAEPGAAVIGDFWSITPLQYAQIVEGRRPDLEIAAALSVPGLDQEAFLGDLLERGVPVYLTVGTPDSPRLVIGSNRLQLLAPQAIHYYPTHRLPRPEFKDLLVPRGGVYRALDALPDLSVERVPVGDGLSHRFGEALELVGFRLDRSTVAPGDSFHVDYFWRLPEATDTDYWVDVLFTNARGEVATVEGLPLWLHSHWIGGGALSTSAWEPGQIMRESYDGLVPRSVRPGAYQMRAFLYQDPSRQGAVPLVGTIAPEEGALLGTMRVEAP